MDMKTANKIVRRMEATSGADVRKAKFSLPYKVGVDLGTSNIVLTVLDNEDRPVAYAIRPASVVRDGIVVEFISAVGILTELKAQMEERLGTALNKAATAIPPGILPGNSKVMTNVVAGAGFDVINVIDEPEAAALALGVQDGAVVDMGGGTTGVSLLRGGKVELSMDEPTGGTHMSLVLAGNLNVDFAQAERFKQDPKNYKQVFPVIRPVAEKMADITKKVIASHDVQTIYLAGGTSCLKNIEGVFKDYIGIPTYKPANPLLITPIGIAMSVQSAGG